MRERNCGLMSMVRNISLIFYDEHTISAAMLVTMMPRSINFILFIPHR